jgi:hypothetical protein
MNCISSKYNTEIIKIVLHDPKSNYEPGFFFIHLHSDAERSVLLYKEAGKWVFYEEGAPLAIEDLDGYKNKFKKERLSNEIILNYLNKLGFHSGDLNFKNCKRRTFLFEQIRW